MSRPHDTSVDAYRRQMAAFRAMTPAERLAIADTMSAEVRALAEAGIRSRHPDASPEIVAALLAERLLGPELARQVRDRRLVAAQ